MKKTTFAIFLVLLGLVSTFGAFAQGGFTGPGSTSNTAAQGELVTVAVAKTLRDDARVTLQGNIVRALGREHYVFKDSTGEITIDIDRKVWRGLSIGENDSVEIYGEVDVERRRMEVEIDVKRIRKL